MPTASGFAALLADALPEPWRYDEKVRAVCLGLSDVRDALLALVVGRGVPQHVAEPNHVDPELTAGIRGQE